MPAHNKNKNNISKKIIIMITNNNNNNHNKTYINKKKKTKNTHALQQAHHATQNRVQHNHINTTHRHAPNFKETQCNNATPRYINNKTIHTHDYTMDDT